MAREAKDRSSMRQVSIDVLKENFGDVPEEVQRMVRRITDEARVRVLGRKAVRSASLKAFLGEQDKVETPPGGRL